MTRLIIEDKGVEKNDIKAIGYCPSEFKTDLFNIVIFFRDNTNMQCDIFYETRQEVKERVREINWYLGGIV